MQYRVIKILCAFIVALLLLALLMNALSPERSPVTTAAYWKKVTDERISAAQDATNAQSKIWYKNSLIYTLDIEVFKDSDGDGIGDINGLISKLDYIKSIGADVIWLAPFQPTANKDDGYDITNYYAVDPRLGTIDQFKNFVHLARQKGLRVIIDFVFNHTSDQHPWFKQSASGNDSLKNWYVWSPQRPENQYDGMVFEGVQKDIWTWSSPAQAYYYHRFYDFEPDLNIQYPPVHRELFNIMNFWLKTGIDGFRIDAVTYLTEIPQTKGTKFKHDYTLLHSMRTAADQIKPDNILLGEANVPAGQQEDFFGKNGESLNMIFNFYVDQRIFYAMATGEMQTLKQALMQSKKIPEQCSWVYFMRNQDEMGMGRFKEKERQQVYKAFAPSQQMQLYNRGVRRRLAPMLDGDMQRLKMAYSLLFALPGIPMIRYGDEIGMGDDLSLKERLAVRTPMQWDTSKNGGFSTADTTIRPVITKGFYAFSRINVDSQQNDKSSLLNWIRRLASLRQQYPAFAYGDWKAVDAGSENVLALRYDWNHQSFVTLHNFSDKAVVITLRPGIKTTSITDIINHKIPLTPVRDRYRLVIEPYGYQWYQLN